MPKEYSIEELNEYVSNLKPSSQPTPTTPSEEATRSSLQSAMIGASRGATFGLAPKIIAGLESIRANRPYEDVLQEATGMYKSASEQNPASYLAG